MHPLSDPFLLNHQDPLKRQAQVQLPFEKPGFSFDAREVQPRSVTQFHMDADVARTAFDGGLGDGLTVIAFEALGQAQHSGQKPRFLSLFPIERREHGMFCAGFGFPVVIANEAGRHVFRPALQLRNLRIVDEIFAVTVVRLAVDEHAAIVKHRGGCQNGSHFKIQMVVRPQLVKELEGENADLVLVFDQKYNSHDACPLKVTGAKVPMLYLIGTFNGDFRNENEGT